MHFGVKLEFILWTVEYYYYIWYTTYGAWLRSWNLCMVDCNQSKYRYSIMLCKRRKKQKQLSGGGFCQSDYLFRMLHYIKAHNKLLTIKDIVLWRNKQLK